jgi:hypothetical protein
MLHSTFALKQANDPAYYISKPVLADDKLSSLLVKNFALIDSSDGINVQEGAKSSLKRFVSFLHYTAPPSRPARAHPHPTSQFISRPSLLAFYMAGMNVTGDSFYGSQGRIDPNFDDKNEDVLDNVCSTYPGLFLDILFSMYDY